ncbi:threonine--tRNA ligase [Candidatus Woesearchaeota archaeon]|nr:threonine--tRNA ligase [Candidatus Woesearchaeota archaeon]
MANLDALRHSAAHLLAAAVIKLWPDAKRTIGPPIEDGFYYDFEFSVPITEADLPKIEKAMKEILQTWKKFEKQEVSVQEAKKEFKDNLYKLELIDEFAKEGQSLTVYQSGGYRDLCRGGHVENPSKELQHFKLLKVAGAYWRGSEKNKMLTRIYGTAFPTKEELQEYLTNIEEAKKRDHRILGKQLDLFSFNEVSPGSVFFHPKGAIIYNELMAFLRKEYKKRGYQEVITPTIYDKSLWETSGHWEHYKENMFVLKMDGKDASLKPMNCPSHILLYKTSLKSYKNLPLRIADFAPLHRNELRGVLGGLTRVRRFSQDDAHIFVTEEQLEQELNNVIDFVKYVYSDVFKFEYSVNLSTKPEKAMGDPDLWKKAEKVLAEVLEKKKIPFKINPGDGAFYGPKIDIQLKDALKRNHQVATIQLDFQTPSRFEATYEGKDGKKHTPIMIHRAILGSLERFIGILIEHFEGKFPTWLAPVQVVIMTIADRHSAFAKKIAEEWNEEGLRVEVDDRAESIGKKVRDNQMLKINYLVTIGDKEMESGNLAIRTRDNKVQTMNKAEFLNQIQKEIKEKAC